VAAASSLLVVAVDVVQAPNDKQQLEPMLEQFDALPEALGDVETLLADASYFSEAKVNACAQAGIDPLIAMGRQSHHPPLAERSAPPPPVDPTPAEAMAPRLKTPDGKKLYALRKQTPQPVLGIIKSVLGFRQFLLRVLENVRNEWSLVTMAWNIIPLGSQSDRLLGHLLGSVRSSQRPDPGLVSASAIEAGSAAPLTKIGGTGG
jgi:hypothetical protein